MTGIDPQTMMGVGLSIVGVGGPLSVAIYRLPEIASMLKKGSNGTSGQKISTNTGEELKRLYDADDKLHQRITDEIRGLSGETVKKGECETNVKFICASLDELKQAMDRRPSRDEFNDLVRHVGDLTRRVDKILECVQRRD